MDDVMGWPQLVTSPAAECPSRPRPIGVLKPPDGGNSIKPGVTNGNPWYRSQKIAEPMEWATDCIGQRGMKQSTQSLHHLLDLRAVYRPPTWAENERASWHCPTALVERFVECGMESRRLSSCRYTYTESKSALVNVPFLFGGR
jgi:hypothetical protein